MDQVRERVANFDTLSSQTGGARYDTSLTVADWHYRSARPTVNYAQVAKGESVVELLQLRLSETDDTAVNEVYQEVLGVVEGDRRRRAREQSKQAFQFVMNWIDQHIDSELSQSDIARGTRQSSGSLRRLVREHAGQSLASFVRNRRIVAALTMLTATKDRLGHIATACGFASQSHFSRTIHTKTGITPSQFRRRHSDHAAEDFGI